MARVVGVLGELGLLGWVLIGGAWAVGMSREREEVVGGDFMAEDGVLGHLMGAVMRLRCVAPPGILEALGSPLAEPP